MPSLNSWIDVEETRVSARTLVQGPLPQPGEGAPGVAFAARQTERLAGQPTSGPAATPAPVAVEDDLATVPEPADRRLVERVRQKLDSLAPIPGTPEREGNEALGGRTGFAPPEGTSLGRLEHFARWASERLGTPVIVLDHAGDPLVGPRSEASWIVAAALVARALQQTGMVLRAEPESRASRMAWLAPDDGAGLALVGALLGDGPIWAAWIDRKAVSAAELRGVRDALQLAAGPTEGD